MNLNKKTYIIAVLVLIIDQVSKSLVEIFLNLHENFTVIKNFFYITVAHNTGGAWSIFSNHSYLFIGASVIAIILLIKFMFGFKNNFRNNLAFGLLFGGIFSNLADRVFLGYVRDFLDFKLFGYDYPIFNIADVTIVVGVLLLVVAVIKGEDKRDKNSC